ncbi:hypothetical protein D3C78_989840 [compost metagenome]
MRRQPAPAARAATAPAPARLRSGAPAPQPATRHGAGRSGEWRCAPRPAGQRAQRRGPPGRRQRPAAHPRARRVAGDSLPAVAVHQPTAPATDRQPAASGRSDAGRAGAGRAHRPAPAGQAAVRQLPLRRSGPGPGAALCPPGRAYRGAHRRQWPAVRQPAGAGGQRSRAAARRASQRRRTAAHLRAIAAGPEHQWPAGAARWPLAQRRAGAGQSGRQHELGRYATYGPADPRQPPAGRDRPLRHPRGRPRPAAQPA